MYYRLILLYIFSAIAFSANAMESTSADKLQLINSSQSNQLPRLPADVWRIIADYLPANDQFLNWLLSHIQLNQKTYDKILEAMLHTKGFVLHDKEIRGFIEKSFNLDKVDRATVVPLLKAAIKRYYEVVQRLYSEHDIRERDGWVAVFEESARNSSFAGFDAIARYIPEQAREKKKIS